ncbi:MAG: hypothetical protein ACON39_05325 [Coraliomargaritaceae bacterium]
MFLFIVAAFTGSELLAVDSHWERSHRIAVSADGNPDADPDDIGATPMTLAILAKMGLQDNLVHYDFNDWLEYKRIPASGNEMWVSARGAQARWGFAPDKFFDAANDPEGAIQNLTQEINKSTKANPLFIVVGGPMELIYQAMKEANYEALAHVTLVSHSGYNEYYKARLWHRNLNDVLSLHPGITLSRIPDQNAGLRTKGDYSPWNWLRDHKDINLSWIYSRLEVGRPDVSDAGMVLWLIGACGQNDQTSVEQLQAFLGSGIIPRNGGSADATAAAPEGKQPEIALPDTQSIFKEVDGRIVIEAESVPLTDSWVVETAEPGFSGTGYIRYMPAYIHAIESLARGVLVYKLRITEPGTYRMALKHSHRGAPERDKWNDCWTLMGIDPAPFRNIRKTYHSISQEAYDQGTGFTFNTTHDNVGIIAGREGHFSKPLYELEAGDHYFFIAGRSGGYRLDKIHIFKEGVSGFKEDSVPSTPVLKLPVRYSAGDDFVRKGALEGRTEYYLTGVKGSVLGINAAQAKRRNKYARAELAQGLEAGLYDVTITTITEIDGESTYRLLINGQQVAVYQNPTVGEARDLKPHQHVWQKIQIESGDTIAIESNSHSNDRIPEGDGFAWARGRWKDLSFALHSEE